MKKLQVGDDVELIGRLQLPDRPRNVGEFDFLAFLRRQGIRAVMRCRSSDAIQLRRRPNDLLTRLRRLQADTRERCEQQLRDKLNLDTTPIAVALLLGSRTRMSPEQREAFVESGTMHVLAISGLNVAILACFVAGVCRLLNVSRILTAIAILGLVGGYAAITEAGPPVVRASLLVFLAALGCPWDRPLHAANLLAVTALGVLLWNPTDAFNAGAQLSFLAVAAILWYVGRPRRSLDNSTIVSVRTGAGQFPTVPVEIRHPWLTTWWGKPLRSSWHAVRETTAMTTFIWLFTAPLIAGRFHLVSHIGVLANIPLLPVASVTLCLGYLMLLVGLVSPWLSGFVAMLFEPSLRLMLGIVNTAAGISGGHQYVPTPPTWWLAGTVALLSTLFWWHRRSLRSHLGWKALWAWAAFGLIMPLLPREPGPLRCTVLAVNHGLAVLIEMPSGRTMLYDGGSMGDARCASDVVQQALWHRGHSRLDGIVLSHADTDHLNGVPALLRTIPVGQVFASPQFVDWRQPEVGTVLETTRRCEVPVRYIWQADSLPLGDGVRCRVLHPTAGDTLSCDNANSVVLSIEFRGRRILLTGDLEKDGLLKLLQTAPVAADVLVSPHHGSLGANTSDLARWATPRWLAVSGNSRVNLPMLRQRFGDGTVVLNTAEHGAITFEIDSHGEVSCQTFRGGLAYVP